MKDTEFYKMKTSELVDYCVSKNISQKMRKDARQELLCRILECESNAPRYLGKRPKGIAAGSKHWSSIQWRNNNAYIVIRNGAPKYEKATIVQV